MSGIDAKCSKLVGPVHEDVLVAATINLPEAADILQSFYESAPLMMGVVELRDGDIVHLSDNAGKGWDSHLPPGEGVLPLDAFLDDLTASDYAGAVSLEVDLRRHLSDPEQLRSIMVSMRERLERRLVQRANSGVS